jgi:hypothetical protein
MMGQPDDPARRQHAASQDDMNGSNYPRLQQSLFGMDSICPRP